MSLCRQQALIDVPEFGMDPIGIPNRAFDAVAGKRYFRRWLELSVEALRHAAGERRGESA